jgi:hypothetical protein
VPPSILVPVLVAPRLVSIVHVVVAPRFYQLYSPRLAVLAAAYIVHGRRWLCGAAP